MEAKVGKSDIQEALESLLKLQSDPEFLAKQRAMLREERKAFLTGFGLLMFVLTFLASVAGIYLGRWLLGTGDPGIIEFGMALAMAFGMVAMLYPR